MRKLPRSRYTFASQRRDRPSEPVRIDVMTCCHRYTALVVDLYSFAPALRDRSERRSNLGDIRSDIGSISSKAIEYSSYLHTPVCTPSSSFCRATVCRVASASLFGGPVGLRGAQLQNPPDKEAS